MSSTSLTGTIYIEGVTDIEYNVTAPSAEDALEEVERLVERAKALQPAPPGDEGAYQEGGISSEQVDEILRNHGLIS